MQTEISSMQAVTDYLRPALRTAVRMSAPAMAVATVFSPALAADESVWEIAPYLWGPHVKGSATLAGRETPVDVSPTAELLSGVKLGGLGFLRWSDGRQFAYAEGLGIRFSDEFAAFNNLPLTAELLFVEAGYGLHFHWKGSMPADSVLRISPYAGLRYVTLDLEVQRPLQTTSAHERWVDPTIGVIVEGPLWADLGYALKLDAAGLGVGQTEYWSGMGVLSYAFSDHWHVAGGYRVTRFDAHPDSRDSLKLDLRGAGPLLGIIYAF